MKSPLLFNAMTLAAVALLASAVCAQTTDDANAAPKPGTSKVRIVRLSQIKGAVQIDRGIGRGYENAIANLPVVEHSQIRTGDGIAEVEFEDNSSLRLAPNSMVEFLALDRQASGATDSTVRLVHGTAYVSLVKAESKKDPVNQFELVFGARKLNLDPAAHVRLDLEGSEAKLAVFDGAVNVAGANGAETVAKKKTATFQIFDATEPMVAKNISSSAFDEWDHTASSYHANMSAFSRYNSPYSYGLSDMSYYGSFANCGGMGTMWRPYFASAGWDPFASGTWAWYGSGYSFVSPYPWAWTPYHSGSWAMCPGMGWGWMPGGDWYGLNNIGAVSPTTGGGRALLPGGGGVRAPHLPTRPPLPHQPTLISTSTRPVISSGIASSSAFVFVKDSAGMGVPRATLGKLDGFSHESMTRGMSATQIYASGPAQMNHGPQMNHSYGGASSGQPLAGSIHRAPSGGYSGGSNGGNPGSTGGNSNAGYGGGSSSGSMSSRSTSVPTSSPSTAAPAGRK
jgi:hypothetical protein